MQTRAAVAASIFAIPILGCAMRTTAPTSLPDDAAGGHAPPAFNRALACQDWEAAAGPGADAALSHVSFPELDPRGCFVRVHDGPGVPKADPPPHGCGYPAPSTMARLDREALRYERIASADPDTALPPELACDLPSDVRRTAARTNARTLRTLARRLASGKVYPYAAASTVGFGHLAQAGSVLVDYRPGDACPALSAKQMSLLSVNITRSYRAAVAQQARIAPVVTVSGGAVHSPLVEAFMLYYLVTCRFDVPSDRVLVDPCADHTHTNLRNTGSLVVALGGRTAYVVTDDGLQSDYLQDWNAFHLIGGSIDQRSLRDFGYLVGSFRQASEGMSAGFWFTPYRFWAEPAGGLGSFTCAR